MTATYFRHGEGRSIAARHAEHDGRMPLSRAKRVVAEALGCTQTVAAAALQLLHGGEWHHVGKFATACDYYDTADGRLAGTVAHIQGEGGAKRWAERRAKLTAERQQLACTPDGSRWYQYRTIANAAIGDRFAALRRRTQLRDAIAARDVTQIRYLCFLLGGDDYQATARRLTGRAYLDYEEMR